MQKTQQGGEEARLHLPWPLPYSTRPSFFSPLETQMPSREQENREGGKTDSRSLLLLTRAIQKSLARHMHTRVIATNQFLKHATFFLSFGTISLFFGFCVFCLELAPVPEKAPLLLRPPAPFSLENAHESERERGRARKK